MTVTTHKLTFQEYLTYSDGTDTRYAVGERGISGKEYWHGAT